VVVALAQITGCGGEQGQDPFPDPKIVAEADWKQFLKVDFSGPEALDNWFLEGSAEVSITEAGELLIENVTRRMGQQDVSRSTLWFKQPVWGDLKYEFEVRGEEGGGNIFFFNAQPLLGHETIFEWERPRANYVDYTAEPRMHMYTLGMLRPHQEEINLRFLGGELAYLADPTRADPNRGTDPDNRFDAETRAEFTRRTVLYQAKSPFLRPDVFSRIELTVIGNRIRVSVDNTEIIEFVDYDRKDRPLRGGYFAFRNFAATRTWCRSITISKPGDMPAN
jgi:hypothetical protein